ncbi:MAG: GntR family transcriptional regulator [Oscillospiraceae bacterium]|nr:GntR family transcriptional regulator [Oscillospiraceae bacterium]
MDSVYKINPELDVPIYQQLVDSIRAAIKNGTLPAGQQLPTVQEMTERLGIARGTIKRAYDELELGGLVEKAQGRGTFVRYQPANSSSRKEQAMAAIDDMLNHLEEMGFSPMEINIFLDLKLRQRAEQEAFVKVAVVECNSECLSHMSEQLRHISGVDLQAFLLENVERYPYQLSEDFDLVVTTSQHGDYLAEILPDKVPLARTALRPSAHSLARILKLQAGEKLGIVGSSSRFAQLMYNTCKSYVEDAEVYEPTTAEAEDLEVYLKDKTVVLVPKFYEKYFSAGATELIQNFGGRVIDCYYKMDEGSVLYLESKIKRLLDAKSI